MNQSVTAKVLHERLGLLARDLSTRAGALGLLALGSVGRETDRLDDWSDLDFFVIVRNGAKQAFIENLAWLEAAHPLLWHFQNTDDGCKALMTDGVFCEFAVFEAHELERIPYAPGRFVWRHNELEQSLATPKLTLPAKREATWLVGEALSNLIIGLQRHARGEKLAAMRMIQVHALDRILEFLELRQLAPYNPLATRDAFNIDRRIEIRSPRGASELSKWAGGYEQTVSAALALLAVLDDHQVVPVGVKERVQLLASLASQHAKSDA